MPPSELQQAKLEQKAHDARINVEVAAQELVKLEQRTEAEKRSKLEEIQRLDEQLDAARKAKALLEQESERLDRECEERIPGFQRPNQGEKITMNAHLLLSARFFGHHIELDASDAAAPGRVWMQIAKEGVYKGYRDSGMKLDAEFFRKVIENFRAHPSFRASRDGVGSAPVVPFDYEHTSELGAMVPGLAQNGAPAIAWACDLETRKGDDGRLELWAFVELGAKLRQQIRDGEYRWTSIAAALDAKDKVTGKKLGPVLTSIAVTNRPFIEGMQPIAANDNPDYDKDASTALGRFKVHFHGEDFGRLLGDAMAEAPDEVRKLFEDAATKVRTASKKTKDEQVAATARAESASLLALVDHYPGSNKVAKAHAMLIDKQPGFKLRERSEQWFLADQFLKTGRLS